MLNLRRFITSRRHQSTYRRWCETGRTLPPPHIVKQKAIKAYAHLHNTRILIETGTYYGHMVEAMLPNFDHIYSIELSPELCELARKKFKHDRNVTILQGDSGNVLPRLLKSISEPCLFWLDGHYSGGVTVKGDKETPIREELNCILSHSIKEHVIMVDDISDFGKKQDYPLPKELREIAESHGCRWAIFDDIGRITYPPPRLPNQLVSPATGGLIDWRSRGVVKHNSDGVRRAHETLGY